MLATRGIAVPDAARERIFASRDLATLDRWIVRAVTAGSIEALFADETD